MDSSYRSDIQNTVPIFCKPLSFDHIIAASVNQRRGRKAQEEEPMRWKDSITLFLALALGAACVQSASAQSPEKNQAVYLYEGADRAQRLAERAREEGMLVKALRAVGALVEVDQIGRAHV